AQQVFSVEGPRGGQLIVQLEELPFNGHLTIWVPGAGLEVPGAPNKNARLAVDGHRFSAIGCGRVWRIRLADIQLDVIVGGVQPSEQRPRSVAGYADVFSENVAHWDPGWQSQGKGQLYLGIGETCG